MTVLLVATSSASSLSGCFNEVSGSPEPPATFGKVERPLFGCPDVEGVYAWPPDAGEHAGRMATNREPWPDGIPVPVGRGPRQVWVELDEQNDRITLRSRKINRDPRVRDSGARHWSYVEYERGRGERDHHCDDGAMVVDPFDVETPHAEDYGGTGIRRGFRLYVLRDGALAIGVQTVAYGRTTSLFSWGGQSYGTIAAPDKEFWSWSRLARVGPGDREPAPIDAGSRASG